MNLYKVVCTMFNDDDAFMGETIRYVAVETFAEAESKALNNLYPNTRIKIDSIELLSGELITNEPTT